MQKKLYSLDKKELVELLKGLYSLSEDNEAYVQTFLQRNQSPVVSLEKYKKIIAKALEYDPIYIHESADNDYDFEKCEKALKAYQSASKNNMLGYAELLVYTIEQANKITLEYGDIDEGYYEAIEEWYDNAAQLIVILNGTGSEISTLVERMEKIYLSTDSIGWGYYDTLGDIYLRQLECLKKDGTTNGHQLTRI